MSGYKLILSTSRRKDGPMGFTADPNNPVAVKNRNRFFRSLDISPSEVVLTKQIHGAGIKRVNRVPHSGFVFGGHDALATNKPNIFLAIKTADCFPVFFYDSSFRAVGIAHAGWRGAMKGIAPKMGWFLMREFGIKAKDIRVIIGPGIQRCHFEIWPGSRHKGIARHLNPYKNFVGRKDGRIFLDLSGIIKYQLNESGIARRHVQVSNDCTYHLPQNFFSYRRDAGKRYPKGRGNMISIIGLKPYEKTAS
ncbi:MAG: peptidoglycan editing factor PgeF [Candidatus Sungiibacteriota bacterium]